MRLKLFYFLLTLYLRLEDKILQINARHKYKNQNQKNQTDKESNPEEVEQFSAIGAFLIPARGAMGEVTPCVGEMVHGKLVLSFSKRHVGLGVRAPGLEPWASVTSWATHVPVTEPQLHHLHPPRMVAGIEV